MAGPPLHTRAGNHLIEQPLGIFLCKKMCKSTWANRAFENKQEERTLAALLVWAHFLRGWGCRPPCSLPHWEALVRCSGAGPGAVGAPAASLALRPAAPQQAIASHHGAVRPPSPLHLTSVMRSWTRPGLINPPTRNWCHDAPGSRMGVRTRGGTHSHSRCCRSSKTRGFSWEILLWLRNLQMNREDHFPPGTAANSPSFC